MRRTLFSITLVSLALSAGAAWADDTTALAKKRFEAGAQAYQEARYADAVSLFLEANHLAPHPALLFNVGQAYEKLGDVPNALRSYREYLRGSGGDDRATVEAKIKNLEERLRERGLQQISVFSTPAGASLTLDGKEVGATPWTGEIAPGRHLVVLRSEGYPDTAKELLLSPDRAMDLDIALRRAGEGQGEAKPLASVAPAPAAPLPKEDAQVEENQVEPMTWVVLGLGVGGLGAALGLEIARAGAEDDARNDPTQVGYADKLDSMKGSQTAARVALGLGLAATAAGGVMLALDLWPKESKKTGKTGAFCTGEACGVFALGTF